jgi:hypothetical protein
MDGVEVGSQDCNTHKERCSREKRRCLDIDYKQSTWRVETR